VTGAVVEIASDESGFSGTNLASPGHPVITHASVDLCTGERVELITALRSRFRFSPTSSVRAVPPQPGCGEALEWLSHCAAGARPSGRQGYFSSPESRFCCLPSRHMRRTRLTQTSAAALTLYLGQASGWQRLARLPLAGPFADLVRVNGGIGRSPLGTVLQRGCLLNRLGAQAKDVLDASATRVQAVLTRLIRRDRSIRHRWSRCCRRWPRPCCSGAAAESDSAGDPR